MELLEDHAPVEHEVERVDEVKLHGDGGGHAYGAEHSEGERARNGRKSVQVSPSVRQEKKRLSLGEE